jgi:sulfide dehydrogenase cytochrome subunit
VLQAQLQAFKAGEMKDATVMPRLAKGYEDRELEALARHFSSFEKKK